MSTSVGLMGGLLPRHTLVWPTVAALERLIDESDDDDALQSTLREWRDGTFPFVARRVDASAPQSASIVAVGLPLPPARGRRRIALTLSSRDIARHRVPLAL